MGRCLGVGGMLLDFIEGGLCAAVDRESHLGGLGFRLDRDLLGAVADDAALGEQDHRAEEEKLAQPIGLEFEDRPQREYNRGEFN
jgi:hypothetical protein